MTTPIIRIPLFIRARFESVWGSPASQDFTGLHTDVPLWPLSYTTGPSFSDIVELKETFYLRGYPENVPGDKVLLTTLEWRLPLLPPLPIRAFGLNFDGLTGVLFYDHARVWGRPTSALLGGPTKGAELFRHTVGWELRLPLRLFGNTLFTTSYGEGQTLDWETGGAPLTHNSYFRLAMTQPF